MVFWRSISLHYFYSHSPQIGVWYYVKWLKSLMTEVDFFSESISFEIGRLTSQSKSMSVNKWFVIDKFWIFSFHFAFQIYQLGRRHRDYDYLFENKCPKHKRLVKSCVSFRSVHRMAVQIYFRDRSVCFSLKTIWAELPSQSERSETLHLAR